MWPRRLARSPRVPQGFVVRFRGAARGSRQRQRVTACLVIFLVAPGGEEALADVAHVVLDGHTFHDEGHEAPDHCCSGAFHFCGCHGTVPAITVVTAMPSVAGRPSPVPAPCRPHATGAPSDAHLREMLRPPAA